MKDYPYMTIQKKQPEFYADFVMNQPGFLMTVSQGFCNVAHDFWVEIPFTWGVVSR